MTDTQAANQTEIHLDLDDFQAFESHQHLNKREMFENQFLASCNVQKRCS